jgi:hypothetical protein
LVFGIWYLAYKNRLQKAEHRKQQENHIKYEAQGGSVKNLIFIFIAQILRYAQNDKVGFFTVD